MATPAKAKAKQKANPTQSPKITDSMFVPSPEEMNAMAEVLNTLTPRREGYVPKAPLPTDEPQLEMDALRPPVDENSLVDELGSLTPEGRKNALLGAGTGFVPVAAVAGMGAAPSVARQLSNANLASPLSAVDEGLKAFGSNAGAGMNTVGANVSALGKFVGENALPLGAGVAAATDIYGRATDPQVQAKFNKLPTDFAKSRYIGEQGGEVLTGETLTQNPQSPLNVPRYLAEGVGGAIKGVGQGLKSAGDYLKTSVVNPVFMSAPNAAIEEKQSEFNKASDQNKQAGMDNIINLIRNAKSQEELDGYKKQLIDLNSTDEGGTTYGDKGIAPKPEPIAPVDSPKNAGPDLKDILGRVYRGGLGLAKDAVGQTAYGAPLDMIGRNLGGIVGPKTASALSIYPEANPDYSAKFDQSTMGTAQANQDAPVIGAMAQAQGNRINAYKIQQAASDKIASQAGWGNTPDKPRDEVSKLVVADKGLDQVGRNIEFAIKNKDVTTISNSMTQLMGISSVVLEQGVVSDPEVVRNLTGMMATIKTLQANGDSEAITRYFDSAAWTTARNALAVAKSQAQSRINAYAQMYPQMVPNLQQAYQSNIDIFATNPSLVDRDGSKQNMAVLDPQSSITQQYADNQRALALIENAKTSGFGKIGELSSFLSTIQEMSGIKFVKGETLASAENKLRNNMKAMEAARSGEPVAAPAKKAPVKEAPAKPSQSVKKDYEDAKQHRGKPRADKFIAEYEAKYGK